MNTIPQSATGNFQAGNPQAGNPELSTHRNHIAHRHFAGIKPRLPLVISTLFALLLLCAILLLSLYTESPTAQANDLQAHTSLQRSRPFTTTTPSPTSLSKVMPTLTWTPAVTATQTVTATVVSSPTGAAVASFHYLFPIVHNGSKRYYMPFIRRFGTPIAPTPVAQSPAVNTPVVNTPIASTPMVTPTPIMLLPPTQMPPAGSTQIASPTPTLTMTLPPTVVPDVTSTPTIFVTPATPATPTGSTTLPPPTRMPEPPLGLKLPCAKDELKELSQTAIVNKVKDNRGCAEPLVDLMIEEPDSYLDAFYELVPSVEATEDLWFAVDTQMRADNFRFGPAHVDSLWQNLPDAIEQCTARRRCDDWTDYILVPLLAGEMYRCPANLDELDEAALLESVPYGNYFCTEDTAAALAALADEETVAALIDIATKSEQGWSRRNGTRVIGRFAERGTEDAAGKLILETAKDDIEALLLDQLLAERDFPTLEDLIWVADSHIFPFFDAQPLFERLVIDTTLSDFITFRSMAAVTRLLSQKEGLIQRDLDFVLDQINSTMPFIRAQSARSLIVLKPRHVATRSQEDQIVAFMEQRLTFEKEFMVRVALQEALDLYEGTNELPIIQEEYEAQHLAASITEDPITIRSGLTQDELPEFLTRMRQTESAFFDVLGPPFDTPVEDDPTEAMTLLLFGTRDRYREYMDAFVGFGSQFGGLYIEKDATLYTFQRTADESSFTIEHLVQHEFTHYLNGRYVFPQLWTDAGFHDQPKGWIDEGAAEYFGLTVFEEDGSHSQPLADARLDTICRAGGSHTGLSELINRRAGYDQPGTFDYDYAWSFMHYLFEQRVPVALRIFDEYRAETYAVEEFAAIAGVPSIDALEEAWHSVMDGWCEDRNRLQAAGLSTLGAHHDTHESQIMNHRGGIYTLPLPPASATGELGDEHDVVRLITSE